jgi:hypothetical protein
MTLLKNFMAAWSTNERSLECEILFVEECGTVGVDRWVQYVSRKGCMSGVAKRCGCQYSNPPRAT